MSALAYLFCAPPAEEKQEQPAAPTTFSIGRAPVSTLNRRQRIAEAKRKRINKQRALRRAASALERPVTYGRLRHEPPMRQGPPIKEAPITYEFSFSPDRWLLTDRGIPSPAIIFLMGAGKTFVQIYMNIIIKKRRQQNHFAKYNCYMTTEPEIPVLKSYLEIAIKNQSLIRSFRRLACAWIRRKLTMKNTEDLVTGEIPVVPVRIVDWSSRSLYTFEARTIARDTITRLTMSHCDFFPWPKLPRNPYTNQELTEAQFYSIAQQLRAAGETHWSIEALYSSKYSLEEYERDMYSKIKRTIHNSVFANPCGDLAKRILLDYIEEEHDQHKMPYENEIYEWAVENASHHHSIHSWRIQCSKSYKIIHFPTEKEKDDKEKESIDAATRRLCVYPGPLIEKYNAVHEKKYVKREDRLPSASQIVEIISASASSASYSTIYFIGSSVDEEEEEEEQEEQDHALAPSASLFTDTDDGEDSSSEAD
jgi:hypothetical protein